jgi:hypothetical protein
VFAQMRWKTSLPRTLATRPFGATYVAVPLVTTVVGCKRPDQPEIAPEPTGHGLPLSKCEAYNRVYEQPNGSS